MGSLPRIEGKIKLKKKIEMPIVIDNRPENNPYPTDGELRIIQRWDILKYNIPQLIDYIQAIWWRPDWGFHLRKGRERIFKKACMKLELHTGGWSGNESIIGALMHNFLFWSMFFEKHITGGHFYFEIRMKEWNRNLSVAEYNKLEEDTNKIMNGHKAEKVNVKK